jgi:hypothetical protein
MIYYPLLNHAERMLIYLMEFLLLKDVKDDLEIIGNVAIKIGIRS